MAHIQTVLFNSSIISKKKIISQQILKVEQIITKKSEHILTTEVTEQLQARIENYCKLSTVANEYFQVCARAELGHNVLLF